MRRFYHKFINSEDGSVLLDFEQSNHAKRVLRLGVGDEIQLFNGEGREFGAEIEGIEGDKFRLRIIGELEPSSPESTIDITLAAALTKGEKFDLVVQKAVELGLKKVVPIVTARSEKVPKNIGTKLQRWQRIVIEASKQCGRTSLMAIDSPISFRETFQEQKSTILLFSESAGTKFEKIESSDSFLIVIGPEGGWDPTEIAFARENSCTVVTLGGRILRAETAAIAVSTLIQNRFGDLN